MFSNIENRCFQIKQKKLERVRVVRTNAQGTEILWKGKQCVNFANTDYLNLANHPTVKVAAIKAVEIYGVGSGASALVTGYSKDHQKLEIDFAEFLERDKALFFSCGYMANLAVMSSLLLKDGLIFQDKLNHASLIEGAKLSPAKSIRFRHADMEHLEALLKQYSAYSKLIVSDAIFGMRGEIAKLPLLASLAEKHNACLVVDEAHSIGVVGPQGRGVTALEGLSQKQVPLVICPLSKAFGGYGAIVAGSSLFIEYLIQVARSYIYTTALPPLLASSALASLKIIREEEWRRTRLQELIYFFQIKAQQFNLPILYSQTPIQICRVNKAELALTISKQLWQKGFLVSAIRPPSVPPNQSCLRITLNCTHTEQQLSALLEELAKLYEAFC